MAFGDIQSTALVPYDSWSRSAFHWNNCPRIIQEYVIKKSFQAQIADHNHFHRDRLKATFWRLTFPLIRITQPQIESHESLDSAITNAQELAHMQLFLRRISKCISSCSTTFQLAYRQNVFLLNKTIAVINAASIRDLKSKNKKITELFFRTLPKRQYDRSLITPGSTLESVLDNVVYQAHHQEDIVDPVTRQKIHKTVAEALFARCLGVKPEKAYSEYHSVYYLLDRSKHRLGVFKPPIYVDPLEDRYGASEDREAHLAEVASSSVDRFLKTEVVPYTQLLTCTLSSSKGTAPVTGSFQFYLDGCDLDSQLEGENLFDPNHEELAIRLDTATNRELKFRNLEGFALFDLLTANNDHHFKNILLKKIAEKVWDLVAIDNANSFPWCHDLDLPAYKMHPNHWFKWSALPQAKKPFSESMITRINTLDLNHLEKITRDELLNQDVPSSKEHIDGKMKTMRDRFNQIKFHANQDTSLREIAKDILTLTCLK
jgi:hypothetical protein